MADAPDVNTVVSHEQDGRVLSGVGSTPEALQEVMDRHSPEPAEESAPVPSPAPGTPATDPIPKRTKGQARFVELKALAEQAEQKAAAAEQRAKDLEAKLNQPPLQPPSQQPGPVPQSQPPQTLRAEMQPTRPEPSEDEIGTKYATYSAFTKDQALWVWEQQQSQMDARIRQGIETERTARQQLDHVAETHVKGRAAYADFDQVLQSGPGGQVQMPMDRLHAIYQLPNSEHAQYVIMRDEALAKKLATVDPITFGMELAKLTPANGSASPAPAVSAAPAPFVPVGTGGKTTVTPSAELADKGFDFDASGYRQKRAAERGVKPRRFGR